MANSSFWLEKYSLGGDIFHCSELTVAVGMDRKAESFVI